MHVRPGVQQPLGEYPTRGQIGRANNAIARKHTRMRVYIYPDTFGLKPYLVFIIVTNSSTVVTAARRKSLEKCRQVRRDQIYFGPATGLIWHLSFGGNSVKPRDSHRLRTCNLLRILCPRSRASSQSSGRSLTVPSRIWTTSRSVASWHKVCLSCSVFLALNRGEKINVL